MTCTYVHFLSTLWYHIYFNHLYNRITQKDTLVNREDPDKMPQVAGFYRGLHSRAHYPPLAVHISQISQIELLPDFTGKFSFMIALKNR